VLFVFINYLSVLLFVFFFFSKTSKQLDRKSSNAC